MTNPTTSGAPATGDTATVRQASETPCWFIDNDDDCPTHYATREALETAREKNKSFIDEFDDERREHGAAKQEPAPCWIRQCTDPDCDTMDDGDGEFSQVHYAHDDKPDDDWLCHEHAPEPEWLTKVKAENAKGPRACADVADDMAEEPLNPGDVARLMSWVAAAGRADNDDNRIRRLVGRLLHERHELRREYIANASTIAELRQQLEASR